MTEYYIIPLRGDSFLRAFRAYPCSELGSWWFSLPIKPEDFYNAAITWGDVIELFQENMCPNVFMQPYNTIVRITNYRIANRDFSNDFVIANVVFEIEVPIVEKH